MNSAKREGLELPFLLTFILRKDVTLTWNSSLSRRSQKSSSENCIQINYTVTEWKWIWNWSFKSIWMEWMGRDSHTHVYNYIEFSIESNVTLTCWSKPQQLEYLNHQNHQSFFVGNILCIFSRLLLNDNNSLHILYLYNKWVGRYLYYNL